MTTQSHWKFSTPFDPENLQNLQHIISRDVMADMTEFLRCIDMDAPKDIREDYTQATWKCRFLALPEGKKTRKSVLRCNTLQGNNHYMRVAPCSDVLVFL